MSAPGWYGKLPSLGDFASRRLPPDFIEPWDQWLATSLASWREADPGWLDTFLSAPVWHFALGAGMPFSGSRGWVGVLMPSVDRVGRYFPLTVVRPRGSFESETPAAWLKALEALAVAALQEDWNAERFDSELAGLDNLEDEDGAGSLVWPEPGRTLWWFERGGQRSEPAGSAGLPDAAAIEQLFGGRL